MTESAKLRSWPDEGYHQDSQGEYAPEVEIGLLEADLLDLLGRLRRWKGFYGEPVRDAG